MNSASLQPLTMKLCPEGDDYEAAPSIQRCVIPDQVTAAETPFARVDGGWMGHILARRMTAHA